MMKIFISLVLFLEIVTTSVVPDHYGVEFEYGGDRSIEYSEDAIYENTQVSDGILDKQELVGKQGEVPDYYGIQKDADDDYALVTFYGDQKETEPVPMIYPTTESVVQLLASTKKPEDFYVFEGAPFDLSENNINEEKYIFSDVSEVGGSVIENDDPNTIIFTVASTGLIINKLLLISKLIESLIGELRKS